MVFVLKQTTFARAALKSAPFVVVVVILVAGYIGAHGVSFDLANPRERSRELR